MKQLKTVFRDRWVKYFIVVVLVAIITFYFPKATVSAYFMLIIIAGGLLANSERELKQVKKRLNDSNKAVISRLKATKY
ncbi:MULTISPECIES: hypothetical protein [Leuconostoc]|jgi:hypothetical protein|uniref:hypothetical protein n=1 Tax=Leuconostoc TaxID=1243 RepID=UPI00166D3C79|nr:MULTISPECIES: hypothetical protein [Leuconostoc]MBK0040467.1 hypothetical protein [Leuconostoc sp. S51]MBK0051640.1 hypothetical protein [Leuconostoc sp. S50]MBS0958032.1 hypothetical protein [Leuconostoc pseudomesenteroides]MCT4379547.1 hypothetical protein [Leuconostoc pseudomesenteroides]MCT4413216.1 hypothetical protein [Leuconostoc pseudomesenteroides]